MKKFKEYTSDSKRKFVALHFHPDTEEKLKQYAIDNGFDISKSYSGKDIDPKDFKFHTTLFYTTSKHDMENGKIPFSDVKIKPVKLELLGKDKNIPVLLVDITDLKQVRKVFEGLGLKDEWPDYRAHVTMSYFWRGYPPIDEVKPPEEELETDHIEIQDIEDSGGE